MIEDQNTEFKSQWKDEYLKSLCAFANTFFRAGYIEEWGRGTINMVKYCTLAGLPEPDFIYDGGLTVLFKKENLSYEELAKIDFEKTTQKTTRKTTQKILAIIKENPYITRKEIAIKIDNETFARCFHL